MNDFDVDNCPGAVNFAEIEVTYTVTNKAVVRIPVYEAADRTVDGVITAAHKAALENKIAVSTCKHMKIDSISTNVSVLSICSADEDGYPVLEDSFDVPENKRIAKYLVGV